MSDIPLDRGHILSFLDYLKDETYDKKNDHLMRLNFEIRTFMKEIKDGDYDV